MIARRGDIYLGPPGHRRRNEPPVYNKIRGSKSTAWAVASNATLRDDAMKSYRKDQKSEGDASDYNFKTWCEVHDTWSDPEYVVNDATKVCHRVLHTRGPR